MHLAALQAQGCAVAEEAVIEVLLEDLRGGAVP